MTWVNKVQSTGKSNDKCGRISRFDPKFGSSSTTNVSENSLKYSGLRMAV